MAVRTKRSLDLIRHAAVLTHDANGHSAVVVMLGLVHCTHLQIQPTFVIGRRPKTIEAPLNSSQNEALRRLAASSGTLRCPPPAPVALLRTPSRPCIALADSTRALRVVILR